MELRRGVMVTPKFLALVFPVRIGAAQQPGNRAKNTMLMNLSRGRINVVKCETPKHIPVAKQADAPHSKCGPARGAGSIPAGGTSNTDACCQNDSLADRTPPGTLPGKRGPWFESTSFAKTDRADSREKYNT